MNQVDATCEACGKPFRWLGGTVRKCQKCALRSDKTVDKPYKFGQPGVHLSLEQQARLRKLVPEKLEYSERDD